MEDETIKRLHEHDRLTNEFEELYDVTFVDSVLFVSLWKCNKIKNKYYLTRDYNIIKTFYAQDDNKATEELFPMRDEILKKEF